MSAYLGPFYIEDKDYYFLIAIALLMIGWVLSLPLPFEYSSVIFLFIIFLAVKAFFQSQHTWLLSILFVASLITLAAFGLPTALLAILISLILLRVVAII